MPTLSGLPEAVVVPPDVVPVLPGPPPPHAASTSIAAAADRLPRVLSCRVSTTTSLLLQSFAQRTPHLWGCQGRAALRPARRPRHEALARPYRVLTAAPCRRRRSGVPATSQEKQGSPAPRTPLMIVSHAMTPPSAADRKSTRLNSSHQIISY